MARYGLFIGINNYDCGITPLSCARQDAQEMYRTFLDNGYAADLMYDHEVNTDAIVKKLDRLTLTPGDIFVFFFSGHGCDDHGEHYLLMQNARSQYLESHIGMIPMRLIKTATDKPGVHRLFILDCCQNDLLKGGKGIAVTPVSKDVSMGNLLKRDPQKLDIIPPLIATSCSPGEKSFENEISGHSYYTEAIINSLKDNSIQNFEGLRKSISAKMLALRNKDLLPQRQTPQWNGDIDSWNNIPFFPRWNVSDREIHPLPQPTQPEQAVIPADVAVQPHIPEKTQIIPSVPQPAAAEIKDSGHKKLFTATNTGLTVGKNGDKIQAELFNNAIKNGLQFNNDKNCLLGCANKVITDIVIPDGVTSIENDAFMECTQLTAVTLPDSLERIGANAFRECNQLVKMIIPGQVKEIGPKAFFDCINLATAVLSTNLLKIADCAFWGCSNLMHIDLPDNVEILGERAFYNCKRLVMIRIPDTVTSVGENIFLNCSSLTSISVPLHLEKQTATWGLPSYCVINVRD